ncbi:MAG: peptide deformylase [Myxococcota bacterium]
MPQRTILEVPDPRLRLPATPVEDFDESLKTLVADLIDTLHHSGTAIGLCAPQVADPRRVLVMDLSSRRCEPQVYINPVIQSRARFTFAEESCLSVPGVLVNVWRATRVLVQAQDPTGAPFERELDGLHAVCLQHEMDHFAGKLLVDRMWFLQRLRFNRRLARA